MDSQPRSPYGIKEPGAPPLPNPWYVRLALFVSSRADAVSRRWIVQSTSGQVVGGGPPSIGRYGRRAHDPYATKLQTQWRSGGARGSRADPVTQVIQKPDAEANWPGEPGNRWTAKSTRGWGPKSGPVFGMDPRPILADHQRPAYLPHPEPYNRMRGEGIHSSGPSVQQQFPYYQDHLLPLHSFNTVPPWRTARPHRDGIALMAGICQWGTRQTWGQWGQSVVIAPVTFSRTNQGVRSIGGILLKDKQGTGRERIPGVFTPTSVQ